MGGRAIEGTAGQARCVACWAPGRLGSPTTTPWLPPPPVASGGASFRVRCPVVGDARPSVRAKASRGGRPAAPGPRWSRRPTAPLRPSLRPSLHPSVRLSLRRPFGPNRRDRRSRGGLPARRLADISTRPPGQDTNSILAAPISLAIILLAPPATGALTIASAPAPLRSSPTRRQPIALGATAIASAPATQRSLTTAPAARRPASTWRREWGRR